MSDTAKTRKSTQEQAVAAWVDHLNQLRLDTLLSALDRQDESLRDALASIDEALRTIELDVVTTDRGGVKGMHGFIAEIAEVGVGNARSRIVGEEAACTWMDDNGPVDLMRGGIEVQQKFVAAGGRFSLGAITEHLRRYPDFVENGGRYQIPRDHFDMIQKLHAMPPEEADKLLARSGDGPSLRDWTRIRNFFEENSLDIDSLEPSNLKYPEVQKATYHSTLESEKESLHSTDRSRREVAFQTSRPTWQEGAKTTLGAGAVEGGATFLQAVTSKRRRGTKLREFTNDDWLDIAGDTSFSFVKGGVRGASIYSLTNFSATSASVASSIVTASFGVADQANKLRRGEIDELEFLENAELVAMESAAGALSAFLGQTLIPVPILGAVIGNAVGTVMYQTTASSLSRREAALIERYLDEQRMLDEQLAAEHQEIVEKLRASMSEYLGILERAFSPDPKVALLGSVDLARKLGVTSEEILDSDEKVSAYFLD